MSREHPVIVTTTAQATTKTDLVAPATVVPIIDGRLFGQLAPPNVSFLRDELSGSIVQATFCGLAPAVGVAEMHVLQTSSLALSAPQSIS